MPLAFVVSAVFVLAARKALGYESAGLGALGPFGENFFAFTQAELQVLIVTWLVVVPLAFLAGLGGFDYWAYWSRAGQPVRRTTPATAPGRGRTTSASTPTTR
jgi:hypothetical protein